MSAVNRTLRAAAQRAEREARALRRRAKTLQRAAERALVRENVRRARQGKAFAAMSSTAGGAKAAKAEKDADAAQKRAADIRRLIGATGGKARKGK